MSAPYYEDDFVRLFCGDCREVLPHLGRVDVVITDPPYGVGLVTKTSDYRESPFFDHGDSLHASVLYDDDPARVSDLIACVMPALLAMSDRMLVFAGPRMLFRYPEPAAVGAVFG